MPSHRYISHTIVLVLLILVDYCIQTRNMYRKILTDISHCGRTLGVRWMNHSDNHDRSFGLKN